MKMNKYLEDPDLTPSHCKIHNELTLYFIELDRLNGKLSANLEVHLTPIVAIATRDTFEDMI